MNCWQNPLGSRKNPSPRWDLNPRSSVIQLVSSAIHFIYISFSYLLITFSICANELVCWQECFCVFLPACKILVFAVVFGLKKATCRSYVSIIDYDYDYDYDLWLMTFLLSRTLEVFQEDYINSRWRLVLDLVFFVRYPLLWWLCSLCPIFWGRSLLFALRVLRASLCCAEVIFFVWKSDGSNLKFRAFQIAF